MKIEIERKEITIVTGHRDKPGVLGTDRTIGYCFAFRGHELACIHLGSPAVGYCGIVLVSTGCGVLDPFKALNPLEAIFCFLKLKPSSHDYVEKTILIGLEKGVNPEHTHAFDVEKVESGHRAIVRNN